MDDTPVLQLGEGFERSFIWVPGWRRSECYNFRVLMVDYTQVLQLWVFRVDDTTLVLQGGGGLRVDDTQCCGDGD